eukprot:TRINITY_DN34156_c3_g2_i1.p1 TRINITY_DN34156_c3_g2~~TRINITY_DN34156_c3_g2_i1.p1  ORF type:complete len:779 (-),score=196.17 TRINITY_DN34156_c3_g2_i1:86-2422(-)
MATVSVQTAPAATQGHSAQHDEEKLLNQVPPRSPRRIAWDRDIGNIEKAVTLVFTNRFAEAEELSRCGAEAPKPGPHAGGGRPVRDLRSGFALHWTLVALMQGLASLANDQLDECLRRIDATRALAGSMEDWAGQRVILGVSLLLTGVVQVLQNSFLKAGISFVRAWGYIGRFDEALAFEGYEAVPLRSFALFTLGVFNFVLSTLPPSLVKVAALAGGPAIKGDLPEALCHLSRCHKEEGQLSPWAAVVLLIYHLNFKVSSGESNFADMRENFDTCERLLKWADDRYPGSAIFSFFRSDLLALQHNVDAGLRSCEEACNIFAEMKMPALTQLVEFKKGVLSMCKLDWAYAAKGCERSMQIYIDVGRRSWVPCLALCAALCSTLDGNEVHARAMLATIATYKKMKKRNWQPLDALALRKAEEHSTSKALSPDLALLDLLELMMVPLSSVSCMDAAAKNAVLLRLDSMEGCSSLSREDRIRVFVVRAELQRLLQHDEEALASVQAGLQLVAAGKLPARAVANGSEVLLRWILVLLRLKCGEPDQAREELKRMDKCPRPCDAYDMVFKFWKHTMRRQLDDMRSASPTRRTLSRSLSDFIDDPPSQAAGDDEEEEGFYSADEGGEEDFNDASSVLGEATAGLSRTTTTSSRPWAHNLEVAVHGHEEREGHTCYMLACKLTCSNSSEHAGLRVTWVTRKRLAQVREGLLEPIQAVLPQAVYGEHFANAPFALRGAPPGTTARLREWFSALGRLVTCGLAPFELVLRFLDAPSEAFLLEATPAM